MDTASQFALTNRKLAEAAQRGQLWKSMENLGINVSRYGLVVTLLLIGALKFTASEAQGISAPGGEQSADVLALSNPQRPGRVQSNWSNRNRRCFADSLAAFLRKTLVDRLHWSNHDILADG